MQIVSIDKRVRGKRLDLFEHPIFIRVNKFDEATADQFAEEMAIAHQTGQPVIPIVIDSFGGQAYSLLDMVSHIQAATLPVATIVTGKAMSCGAILFSYGTDGYRYMSPQATLMIHEVANLSSGKIEELKADTVESERINKLVFHSMAKNCGHNKEYFLDLIHEKNHSDWFLTAEEAKEHKLCNHIGLPKMKSKVALDITWHSP